MSESTKIIILSKSQDIKKHESVKFLMKGKELTIDSLIISSQSVHMGFVTGETKSIEITEKNGKSIISRIASSLNNEKINTDVEYDAKEFNREYLPELSEILSSYPKSTQKGNKGISDINNRSTTESNRAVGTTTELFNFEATKELERSTTEGINHTIQEIYEYNDKYNIADGAFDIRNGTAKWNSGLVNGTLGERSVFNETSIGEEPTAIPAIAEQGTGMSAEEMANWAAVGGLGLMAVVGAVVGYCAWSRRNRKEYNINTVEKARNGDKRFDSENPRISNGGAEAQRLLSENGNGQTEPLQSSNSPSRSLSGSSLSLHTSNNAERAA